MLYLTLIDEDRFGIFSPSIRRVGKMAFWLAISSVFGLLLVAVIILQPKTISKAGVMTTLWMRFIGYIFRVLCSFAQVMLLFRKNNCCYIAFV
jgi:hypothetical protein